MAILLVVVVIFVFAWLSSLQQRITTLENMKVIECDGKSTTLLEMAKHDRL
jgi:hypothetical protein